MDLIGKRYKSDNLYIAEFTRYNKGIITRIQEPIILESDSEYRTLDLEGFHKIDESNNLTSKVLLNDVLVQNGLDHLLCDDYTDKEVASYIMAIDKKNLMSKSEVKMLDSIALVAVSDVFDNLVVPKEEILNLNYMRNLSDRYGVNPKNVLEMLSNNLKENSDNFKGCLLDKIKISLYCNKQVLLSIVDGVPNDILRYAATKSKLGMGYFKDFMYISYDAKTGQKYVKNSNDLASKTISTKIKTK